MKLRTLQSVLLAASAPLIGVASFAVPASARAADVTVRGVVRDSGGIPQMGVLVQLLRADASVIQSVHTDEHGSYFIAGVLPGVYQLKAIETSFLPTLRENLHVSGRSLIEANLTVSTLLESLSWLPAHKRSLQEPEDDWAYTLRSAAYRPLLRYVDPDGLETIEPGEGRRTSARSTGRLLIESGTRSFAEGGVHQALELQRQDSRGGTMLLRGSLADAGGSTSLMAGYAQQNRVGSGLASVVSYQSAPQIAGPSGNGMQCLSFRTVDTLQLLPNVRLEAGNQLQVTTVGTQSLASARPFGSVAWSAADTTASYSVSTAPRVQGADGMADAASYASLAGEQDGILRAEHGLHQELKLEHDGNAFAESVALYQERIDDPMLDAMGMPGNGGKDFYDGSTNLVRIPGTGYASRGIILKLRHQGNDPVYESIEFATGSALKAPEKTQNGPVFAPERAKSIAMIVGGRAPLTGTSWKAAYRLQPGGSITAVDLFDAGVDSGMADAYLSVFLRQPLHRSRVFPGGVDAVVNVRNLLAQGYHPFVTSDGTTLFFAQVDRSVQGGLAFYF